MSTAGIIVFAVTYVLISARRLRWLPLDRPAAALVGAVAVVLLGALPAAEALAAINGATILLLFGVMGMGAFLALDGFFDDAEAWLLRIAPTPQGLLGAIVWGSGALAAVITNDAVCVLAAPLVVRLVQRQGLPPLPYLLALATAANTGSVATLVGNPQNMLCGLLGGLSYGAHAALLGPVAVAGLAINHGLLAWLFRGSLRGMRLRPPAAMPPLRPRVWLTLSVLAGTVAAYTAGADLAWAATGGFAALLVLHRRDAALLWARIDWSILLFFAGLFVVVEGLVRTGLPARVFAALPLLGAAPGLGDLARGAGIFLLGSNVVSNVPFILVVRETMQGLPDPRLGWELLAMASTFAGNLTLLGSVANIIVAERAREIGGIGFWAYFRVGLPLTLLTTAWGVLWLWWVYPGP